ncbi:hypothetical protein [Colwellia sp. RSH04]|uniref:hypothetical protein n=1 Tax=Colwellia sp. RSH04 TaxID=2305464 RepID=UPI000E5906AE|nr:hypothetical protein [Colwellia sp. RSH04]RHW76085.1 hypothetical protein D1094_10500 [Colwellia sp. RSH04]
MTNQQTSNIIELLSQLASDASLNDTKLILAQIEQADINDTLKALIASKNVQSLSDVLELNTLIKCNIIRTPDEDDDDDEQEQPDSTEEKSLAVS